MNDLEIKKITDAITAYDIAFSHFKQKWYVNITFALVALFLSIIGTGAIVCYVTMLIAILLFLLRINQKNKLQLQKSKLKDELNQLLGKISIESYLELSKKLVSAGNS